MSHGDETPRRDTRTKGTDPMNREPIPGECVVVTRNTGDHGGRVGERYIVSHVDDGDDTIKAIQRGSSTVTDYWIPWSDIEPVTQDHTRLRGPRRWARS